MIFDPLTLNPNTQEDTQAGDRVSMDEERAQTLYARQQATQRVVGTVSGYLQSVVEAAQSSLERTDDPETAQAQREVISNYAYLARVHGYRNFNRSPNPVRGVKLASRKITAEEVLSAPDLPTGTRETLEQRKIDLDTLVSDAVEETWVKEGVLLSQEELEAMALNLEMDRPESNLDPTNPRVTVESYIHNFCEKK